VYKTGRVIFFFYCNKTMGQQQGGGSERIQTYTNGVRYLLEKTSKEKTFKYFWDKYINVGT
jgi:hypothetical protein